MEIKKLQNTHNASAAFQFFKCAAIKQSTKPLSSSRQYRFPIPIVDKLKPGSHDRYDLAIIRESVFPAIVVITIAEIETILISAIVAIRIWKALCAGDFNRRRLERWTENSARIFVFTDCFKVLEFSEGDQRTGAARFLLKPWKRVEASSVSGSSERIFCCYFKRMHSRVSHIHLFTSLSACDHFARAITRSCSLPCACHWPDLKHARQLPRTQIRARSLAHALSRACHWPDLKYARQLPRTQIRARSLAHALSRTCHWPDLKHAR